MQRLFRPGFAVFCLALAARAQSAENRPLATLSDGVQISKLDDRLRVEINGQLFTEYFFKDVPRPYCYPIIGPEGLPMTRNWPMKDTPGEEHDHPHHRSLWFTHGSVNGYDFWSEAKDFGKIQHVAFDEVESGKDFGVIRERNNWVWNGQTICTDERALKIYANAPGQGRMLDFEITIKASDGDVTFGDTKEGSMALRLAETMRLKGGQNAGHIVNSAGDRDGATWGKRADWCDYYGPVEGKVLGVAIFDHPSNPRHPTWWHVRDYGLFAANPFGRHDFEKLSDKKAGDLVIPAGKSLTFRYRIYLHPGDTQQANVAGQYQEYVKSPSSKTVPTK